MSLSTTSTTTYALAKYSRAYPSQNSTAREADVEWQHYTNPVIRLALDIKKSAQGELESYRVRIIWSLNAGQSAMDIDHRDVMFVSLPFHAIIGLSSSYLSPGRSGITFIFDYSKTKLRFPWSTLESCLSGCCCGSSLSAPSSCSARLTCST